jgi:hypothetical protein
MGGRHHGGGLGNYGREDCPGKGCPTGFYSQGG